MEKDENYIGNGIAKSNILYAYVGKHKMTTIIHIHCKSPDFNPSPNRIDSAVNDEICNWRTIVLKVLNMIDCILICFIEKRFSYETKDGE